MAGRVITVAQQKGGAGKTTLAAHLAVAWALSGRRVAVVDIDPQGSLTAWGSARASAGVNGRGALTHAQVSGWRTQSEVDRLARTHDLVVIDSPPHAETEAKLAVRAASVVVVPIQPSPMDLWAIKPTLDLARAEKRGALIVLNRVPPRSTVAELLAERVVALGVPMARTAVGNRTGFAAAMLDGLTIVETDPRSKGAEEMMALAEEVLALT